MAEMAEMAEMTGKKTAIVVGAGVGGVASAARLAKSGFQVTVLEKNGFTGGRCSLIHKDGYRFDQGPSLLLLPQLFRETFHDLSHTLSTAGLNLLKCDPNYSLWFSDNESFSLSTDTASMKSQIEKWEGKAGFQRYLAWLSEAHDHYEISVTEVLHKKFNSLFAMLRPSFLGKVFTLHPFESIYSRASRYFYSERLRRVFTFGSMYMGMSPFDAPGTYSLLQYTEIAEGIWYPVGGFHAVVAALVKIGEELGVTFRLNTAVASVITSADGSKAVGVRLESGEELSADVVLINADLVYAYNNLFSSPTAKAKSKPKPTPPTSYAQSLSKRATSCSSISFYWSLSTTIPSLTAHNIFLASDYRDSFDAIFTRHSLPSEPSFYVNVPSRIDPSASPAGTDAIVVLVPTGHLPNSNTSIAPNSNSTHAVAQSIEEQIAQARRTVLATISARTGCPDLAPLIKNEIINTPQTWEMTFNLDKGAILGLSHSFFNVLAFRPKMRHQSLKGCYFVGASTHPGTGVPIVLAGAKMCVEEICGDLGVEVPWGEGGKAFDGKSWEEVVGDRGVDQGDGVKEIDRSRKPLSVVALEVWIGLLAALFTVYYVYLTGY